MLWLLSILLFIICILCYVLVAPFYLEINSLKGLYRVRFHRLASAQLTITGNTLIIDLMIVGWHRQIDVLASPVKNSTAPKAKKKTKSGNRRFNVPFHKVRSVIKSFKVRECYLEVDTGDVEVNGILFPVFYLFGKRYNKPVAINFINKNIIVLVIENNFARMIRAFIFY